MNISLPAELKEFVDDQVARGAYGTSSEFVRELLRREKARLHLRSLIVDGLASGPPKPVDKAYFKRLKDQIRTRGSR